MNSKECALLIMHCQNDIVHPDGLYSHSGVYKQIEANRTLNIISDLADFCRKAGMLVIYINNEFKEGYPELGEANLPICIDSRNANAFLAGTWGAANPEIIQPKEKDLVIKNVNTIESNSSLPIILNLSCKVSMVSESKILVSR